MAAQPDYPSDSAENQAQTKPEFQLLLQVKMKYKARSHETCHGNQLPELKSIDTATYCCFASRLTHCLIIGLAISYWRRRERDAEEGVE
jgi:hypothetical protein